MKASIAKKQLFLKSLCIFFACGIYSSFAIAAISITSPTNTGVYNTQNNTVQLSGITSGSISTVSYACQSGCNNSGTATGITSWTSGIIYLNGGSNIINVTARYANGTSETISINVYNTTPQDERIAFPYNLNFDNGPSSLEKKIWATGGASVTHQDTGCWSGGCVKMVPSAQDNTYSAIGGFLFPSMTQRFSIRYLMYFGPDFVRNLNTRHKHILAHRGSDVSSDRAMAYVWTTEGQGLGIDDLSIGACDNTDCRFEGGKTRPNGSESFLIGEHLQEWVSFEAEFDTVNHRVRFYVTTLDGTLYDHLLAERQIHSISSNLDYWTKISILGAFIDLGTTASSGMYWLIDDVVISNSHIGPPDGFATARPNPPAILNVQ